MTELKRVYQRDFGAGEATVGYRLDNDHLEVKLMPPTGATVIQPLPFSENPGEIYEGLSQRVLGPARLFLQGRNVKDWIQETYGNFLNEYRRRSRQ